MSIVDSSSQGLLERAIADGEKLIRVRMAAVDEDIWPQNSTIPLVPPNPADRRTEFSQMMLDGRVVHYDILEEIYAEINARFGSNAQVPRQR